MLRAGGVLVELVEYIDPQGRPRPSGYRISDQGIMNVAFGFSSADAFDRFFARAVDGGCRPNGRPLDAGVFRVMYVNTPTGESVELLYPRRWAYGLTGFRPSPACTVRAYRGKGG